MRWVELREGVADHEVELTKLTHVDDDMLQHGVKNGTIILMYKGCPVVGDNVAWTELNKHYSSYLFLNNLKNKHVVYSIEDKLIYSMNRKNKKWFSYGGRIWADCEKPYVIAADDVDLSDILG